MFKIFAVLVMLTFVTLPATTVIEFQGADQDIAARWEWAISTSRAGHQPVWISYNVKEIAENELHIGSWSNEKDDPTLSEVLGEPGGDYRKDVALIFQIYDPGTAPFQIGDLKIASHDSEINLKDRPLYWLGDLTPQESVVWLQKLYREQKNSITEEFVAAFGIHHTTASTDMLINIARTADADIQEDAIFWLGQHGNEKAFDFLLETLENHPSTKVKKAAVFAASQIKSGKAVDVIIRTARSNENEAIRKEAIFWLGQMAAEKSAASLEDIIRDDPDIELKKHAVFSLSQMDDEQSVDSLINIARNHPNFEVRKSAIFWLGETDSDKALEVLVGILKE